MALSALAERLEKLRLTLSIPSVQEFVDRVNDRTGEQFVYATARRYHREREPTVPYIAAVARAFEVSLEWLLYGEGEMMAGAQKVPAPEQEASGAGAILAQLGWSPGREALFSDLWRRYVAGFQDRIPEEQVTTIGLYLRQFVLLPFRHHGFKELDELSPRELQDYLHGMMGALGMAMPDPGKGDRFSEIGSRRLWGFRGSLFFYEEEGLPHPGRALLRIARSLWEEQHQTEEAEETGSDRPTHSERSS